MPVIAHIAHEGVSGHSPPVPVHKSPVLNPRKRFILVLSAGVAIVLLTAGLILARMGPPPPDADVDARLAALQRRAAARRAQTPRAGSTREVGNRIWRSNADRKAEERSLMVPE